MPAGAAPEQLLALTKNNKSFSKVTPGLQLVWDSVSSGLMKECAWEYYLTIIEGWTPNSRSPHLDFGIYTHKALEIYHKARAKGDDYPTALRKALRKALEISGERKLVKFWKCHSCEGEWAEKTCDGEICPGCDSKSIEGQTREVWKPWISGHPNKNRENLIRTVAWYLDEFRHDPAKTVTLKDGTAGVELSFRFELPGFASKAGEIFMLAGHLDRLVEFNKARYVNDYKTSKNKIGDNFFAEFSPDNQMSLYSVGGNVIFGVPIAGVLIDGIQVAVNFSKAQRGFATRNKAVLDEWVEDMKDWIGLAEGFALAGRWPMNDTSCHKYGGCDFRGVCSRSPSSRQRLLETHFHRRMWDPLEVR